MSWNLQKNCPNDCSCNLICLTNSTCVGCLKRKPQNEAFSEPGKSHYDNRERGKLCSHFCTTTSCVCCDVVKAWNFFWLSTTTRKACYIWVTKMALLSTYATHTAAASLWLHRATVCTAKDPYGTWTAMSSKSCNFVYQRLFIKTSWITLIIKNWLSERVSLITNIQSAELYSALV